MKKAKGKVFVGLSGGVDSSVSALRLQQEGYDVIGVFIKVWQPDFLDCNWEAERLDAMRVAASLKIPFLTFDGSEAYKKEVGEYFIREYEAGKTPNPDVFCNKAVKFGVFLDFALEAGADFVATGHYAQSVKCEQNKHYKLLRGADQNKDQSYFLWTLTQSQLSHIMFPVGNSSKEQIREEAEKAGLTTASKKDSQGVCFLGHIDLKDFLSHFINITPGDLLNTKGEVIGVHDGAQLYTIGQRQGFTLNSRQTEQAALYVVRKDIQHNTVTVDDTTPRLADKDELSLIEFNNITEIPIQGEYEAQFRYRQTPFKVTVTSAEEGQCTLTVLDNSAGVPADGQSCVLYKGNECLGGGIIRT